MNVWSEPFLTKKLKKANKLRGKKWKQSKRTKNDAKVCQF